MLLQKVKLKGFLAHRGVENGDYKGLAPVEIDFTGSHLWLVHGPNGAGKSSIFDAITFALFDRVRDRGNRFGEFVNDLSDRAEVEIELQIGDQTFLVERGVSKKGTNSGQVLRVEGDKKNIEAGSTNAVAQWAEDHLRVSYENFVSAVILRQGEADIFLNTKPAKRKEQLMKLLDLGIYRKLGEAANAQLNLAKRELACRDAEVAAQTWVSDEQISDAQNELGEAEAALESAQIELNRAETLVRDAVQAAKWEAQIAENRRQKERDKAILEIADSIENAAARKAELEAVLPRLEAIWDKRRAAEKAEIAWRQAEETVGEREKTANELAPDAENAVKDQTEKEYAETRIHDELATAREQKTGFDGQIAELNRVEKLEAQLNEAEAQSAPFAAILERAAKIESDWKRYRELKAWGEVLGPIVKAERLLNEAEKAAREARKADDEAAKLALNAQKQTAQARAAAQEIEAGIETTRVEGEQLAQNRAVLAAKIGSRANLGEATECPTCGTELHDETTHERLENERQLWESEAADLDEKIGANQKQIADLRREWKTAQSDLSEAGKAERAAQITAAQSKTALKNAESALESAETEWETAREEAGESAERTSEYDAICADFGRLKDAGIAAQWEELSAAQNATRAAQAKSEVYREQLANSPVLDAEERRQLRENAAQIAEKVARVGGDYDAAKTALEAARKKCVELQKQLLQAQQSLDLARSKWGDAVLRLETSREDFESANAIFEGKFPAWREHPATQNESDWRKLSDDLGALENAAARLDELETARGRLRQLDGAIAQLEGELSHLPAGHKIEVEDARNLQGNAANLVRNARERREIGAAELERLRRQKADFEKADAAREAAEKVCTRADKLARDFGTRGLQAEIVRKAQGDITLLANDILGRLSQGGWQIDLRPNKDDTELEIIARDLSRGDNPHGYERPFENLSGGERFRVAISLAIAIGQSACGGHAMNTLVIDEGFGALDDVNRGLLVSELRRLSQDVLRGGRIIIVSHQEDVCDEFDFRYKVLRDEDGYARVERHTP